MANRSCENCRYCKKVSEDETGLLIIYRCEDDGYFEMEKDMRSAFCCHNHYYKRINKDAE